MVIIMVAYYLLFIGHIIPMIGLESGFPIHPINLQYNWSEDQTQIGYRQGRLYSTDMHLQNKSSLASASSTREAPIRLPRAADKVAANIPMYTNPDHRFTSCRKL